MTLGQFADANLCGDACDLSDGPMQQLPNYIFDGLSNDETMALLGDKADRNPRAFLPNVTTFLESVASTQATHPSQ